MIVRDKMPLCTVDNEGFQSLMKIIAPLYPVPSRRTMTRLMDVQYETSKKRFMASLTEVDSYCLTCNNWTDNSQQSYLGVTIHYVNTEIKMKSGCIGVFPLHENHTAGYLEECLRSIMEDFNLDISKISAIVTDRAANIKRAVRKIVGKEKHLFCFAHLLSHLVPDVINSMPIIKDMIAKVKVIVALTRRSVVANDELKKAPNARRMYGRNRTEIYSGSSYTLELNIEHVGKISRSRRIRLSSYIEMSESTRYVDTR